MKPIIDYDKCDHCEDCWTICPCNVFGFKGDIEVVVEQEEECDGCELCADECHAKAITIMSEGE